MAPVQKDKLHLLVLCLRKRSFENKLPSVRTRRCFGNRMWTNDVVERDKTCMKIDVHCRRKALVDTLQRWNRLTFCRLSNDNTHSCETAHQVQDIWPNQRSIGITDYSESPQIANNSWSSVAAFPWTSTAKPVRRRSWAEHFLASSYPTPRRLRARWRASRASTSASSRRTRRSGSRRARPWSPAPRCSP